MLKICIVTGARPNFIKVAPLMRTINKMRDNGTDISCQLIYTGSKDDVTLEFSLFDDLQMPHPDVFLGVMEESINELTARVMSEFDHWLDKNPTDKVIVVDDLASAMAASLSASTSAVPKNRSLLRLSLARMLPFSNACAVSSRESLRSITNFSVFSS